mgnify:CR=1 FL=1
MKQLLYREDKNFQHINDNFQFLYKHVLAASSAFVSVIVN